MESSHQARPPVIHLFQPGDHIIAGNDIYGGAYRLIAKV
jgi:O-acetylhomoserine/O-acetylserine sulfhydrylase-like pyridoxal-dependent enzyme